MQRRSIVAGFGFMVAIAGCAHAPPQPGTTGSAAAAAAGHRVVVVVEGVTLPKGAAPTEKLLEPFSMALDPTHPGELYISEHDGNRVRRFAGGVLTTVAGTGPRGFGGDGGPGPAAILAGPHHIAFAPDGVLIVADTFNQRVRSYDTRTGIITTVAGTGAKGFSGDGGPATEAQLAGAFCLAFDPTDATGHRLYIADVPNKRIRLLDRATGVITTFAGNGTDEQPADGAEARSAPLRDPRAVAADRRGNVYVLSRNGHTMHVIDAQGKIRRVAGTGVAGFSGDGGDARLATMRGPKHIGMDLEDNVLITDTENHAIRKYQPADGRIVLVAGTGAVGAAGVGGPPEAVQMNRPHGTFVDAAGAIYIADSENHRILKIQ